MTWGSNARGQLGLITLPETSVVPSPTPVAALSGVPLVQVAAGGAHTLALSVSGTVFGWGQNDAGQLGLGDTTGIRPEGMFSSSGRMLLSWRLCELNLNFSFSFEYVNKIVFQFTFSDRSTPVTVECLNLKKTVSVSCGERHTAVLTKVPTYSAFSNVVSIHNDYIP